MVDKICKAREGFGLILSGKGCIVPGNFYKYRWSGNVFEIYIDVINGNMLKYDWVEANYRDFYF